MAEADPRPAPNAAGAGPALRSVDSPRVPDLARRDDPGPEDRRAATLPPCGQNRPGQPALLGEHENDVTGGGFYSIYIIYITYEAHYLRSASRFYTRTTFVYPVCE